jgi:small-conductance mechanosensitive channel
MSFTGFLQRAPADLVQEEGGRLVSVFRRLWASVQEGGSLEKLAIFVLLGVALWLLSRVVRRGINHQIQDVNRRHQLRKIVNYSFWIVLAVSAVTLFFERLDLADLGTVLGLLAAAVTIALADVVRSLAGWLYLNSRSGIEIGSRVEVEGIKGDVIDIGLLKTTLLEVGEPLVHALQSTGRIVTVPNSSFLNRSVFASASVNPLVWQEIQVLVTFESDWKRAREINLALANELHEELVPEVQAAFRTLERRYAYRLGPTTPIVYTEIHDSGVMLTLRSLTHVRRRRGTVDRISTQILDRFDQEPDVEFAYPTYRVYRMGEENELKAEIGLPGRPTPRSSGPDVR